MAAWPQNELGHWDLGWFGFPLPRHQASCPCHGNGPSEMGQPPVNSLVGKRCWGSLGLWSKMGEVEESHLRFSLGQNVVYNPSGSALLVGVLHGKPRLLTSGKQVASTIVVAIRIEVVVVIVIIAMLVRA